MLFLVLIILQEKNISRKKSVLSFIKNCTIFRKSDFFREIRSKKTRDLRF